MPSGSGRIASQLRDFIDSNHIYADELTEEQIEKIRDAAEKDPEELVPQGITKRKGKSRRSIIPRYPSEWASSREAFRNAVWNFEYEKIPLKSPKPSTPPQSSEKTNYRSDMPSRENNNCRSDKPSRENINYRSDTPSNIIVSSMPKDVWSLFNGFDKLNGENWDIWKGHMQDNLQMCDLWEIVIGRELEPDEIYRDKLESWKRREMTARVVIKNLLGPKDYQQIRHARTASDVWNTLVGRHQPTGAQGKVDLIWRFWSKRCAEGEPIHEHIGEIRALHAELSDIGIFIEDHMVAILMSKSLPPSYDTYVSSIFAGIRDLDQADPNYVANKLFEEEMRRGSKSQDANVVVNRNCINCGRNGHLIDDCYSKGGGKEGQGPRQIARRKKLEAEKKKSKIVLKDDNDAQLAEQESFYASHMVLLDTSKNIFEHSTFYSESQNSWIADSGASTHIANRRDIFTSFTPSKGTLNVAGGLTATVEGTGTVCMRGVVNGILKDFKLINVLYVPTTQYCLISGSKLDKAGGRIVYGNGRCSMWNSNGEAIATGTLNGDLYRMNAKALENKIPAVNVVENHILSWQEAHRRLGHISLTSMKLLFKKGLIKGIMIDKNEPIPNSLNCVSCVLAKAHRAPFPIQVETKSRKIGDLTHTDVWGSPNVKHTPGGNQYFILFIDDFTRHISVKLMKDKISVKQQLMNYCNFVHTQYNRWPKEIRSDNAAEYEGTRNWLEERGIQLKPSAPHSPQQNGVSERMNRTLLDLARAMRLEKQLPESLWGEAVLHAAWIRNRSPTTALNGKTPMEVLTGNCPDLSMSREFGEEVYVLEEIPKPKIEPKSRKVIFTGFEDGPKAIRYYDSNTRHIKISRNFSFLENPKACVEKDDTSQTPDENKMEKKSLSRNEERKFLEEHERTEPIENISNTNETKRVLRTNTKSGHLTKKDYADLAGFNPRDCIRQPKSGYSVYFNSNERIDGNYYLCSSHFANVAYDILTKNGDDDLPNTIQQARQSHECDEWENAVTTELGTLQDKDTWELVDPPKESKVLGIRWVFTK